MNIQSMPMPQFGQVTVNDKKQLQAEVWETVLKHWPRAKSKIDYSMKWRNADNETPTANAILIAASNLVANDPDLFLDEMA